MIDQLDKMLVELFKARIPGMSLAPPRADISLLPPDGKHLQGGDALSMVLDVYLADIRENRKLRSNVRTRQGAAPNATEVLAPTRLECHYLISAWSRSTAENAREQALRDEHGLLYDAAAALIRATPLNATEILEPDKIEDLPEAIRNADLPTEVLPMEGFAKLAEFWGLMGSDARWRPLIYLVVTLPVEFEPLPTAPPVRSIGTFCRQMEPLDPTEPDQEPLFLIGGLVRRQQDTDFDGTAALHGEVLNAAGAKVFVLMQTRRLDAPVGSSSTRVRGRLPHRR